MPGPNENARGRPEPDEKISTSEFGFAVKLAAEEREPKAMYSRDYIVEDRGNGPKLKYWNEDVLGPMPTMPELKEAYGRGMRRIKDKESRREQARAMIMGPASPDPFLTLEKLEEKVLQIQRYIQAKDED